VPKNVLKIFKKFNFPKIMNVPKTENLKNNW
jgi:hypothetical protein